MLNCFRLLAGEGELIKAEDCRVQFETEDNEIILETTVGEDGRLPEWPRVNRREFDVAMDVIGGILRLSATPEMREKLRTQQKTNDLIV